jgi:quinol-cytochrome oxidoreductase complex cytochrome b subunit
MSTPAIIQAIYDSGIAMWMRGSLKAMPLIEATHVLAIATVFGTIFIVDLRLLGLAGTNRPYSVVAREMLGKTWAAFVLAVITGVLLFAPNAITYFGNTAFRLKMLALVVVGINMAVFKVLTARSMPAWDTSPKPPSAARTAAIISLLVWTAVIFLGRWIGFTKGYDFSVPDDIQFDFTQ